MDGRPLRRGDWTTLMNTEEQSSESEDMEEKCREGMADRIRAITRITAPLMRDTPDSTRIFDDLYDEMGLPK